MKAFKIRINNRCYDYRIGERINIKEVNNFFKKRGYKIIKFILQQRHICAITENNTTTKKAKYFLKLSTSKGISIVTENEAAWNDAITQDHPPGGLVLIPKIHDRGYYKNEYFYLITEYIDGPLATYKVGYRLETRFLLSSKIDTIIDLSEKIMSLKIPLLPADSYNPGKNHQEKFINKVRSHFESVPKKIREKYQLKKLLQLIEVESSFLECRPRHGDFAPWHLIVRKNPKGNFYLIDGEHAMSQSVEYYDLSYFIQRVFSVWKDKKLAIKIYEKLLDRGYNKNKLKTILSARAIGGFLDESLVQKPDYKIHEEFKNWLLSI